MGRSPCCDDFGIKKGPWTPDEDKKLVEYILKNGHDNWRHLPKNAGLNRCGKSCRLRWINYLRPDIKRGKFTEDEEQLIIQLHSLLGNKWSAIARRLKGRTDNEIKNYWNTHLKKKLMLNGIDPVTHRRRSDHLDILASIPNLITASANINVSNLNTLRYQLLQSLVQLMSSTSTTTNINFLNSLDSSFIQNHVLMQDLSLPQLSNHYQTCANPNFPLQTQEIDAHNTSFGDSSNHALFNSFVIPTNNSSPSLVLPTSPGMFTGDQMREPINSSYISANSSSEELCLDDLDIDLSWKNILDQISWSDKW